MMIGQEAQYLREKVFPMRELNGSCYDPLIRVPGKSIGPNRGLQIFLFLKAGLALSKR